MISVLVPAAMLGIPPEVARKLRPPVGQGLTGRVAASGKPLVIADVEREGGSLYPDFNRTNQYTSFMGVPVIYRGSIVGVLSVMTIQRREFSRDEELLLAGMADQAAIALQNAQLFEERERQIAELTTLNRISRAINATLDLDELLRSLHHGIGEVLDISISFIGLYDQASRRITFPIARIDGQDYQDDEVALAEQAGYAGRARDPGATADPAPHDRRGRGARADAARSTGRRGSHPISACRLCWAPMCWA